MKWLRTLVLFDKGNVISSSGWKEMHESYVRSIASIDFPQGKGTLTLRRKVKRADGQWNRNGVGYLRSRFLANIVTVELWKPEAAFDLGTNRSVTNLTLYPSSQQHSEPITSEFGGFDFVTRTKDGIHVAIEWETGNISSSHRSMNKLAIALETGKLDAGVLIVPSRALYKHLTDRIGNIGELSGYLQMWQALGAGVKRGLLAITVVEYDALTDDRGVPYLPLGEDGRAKQGRAKRR